MTDRILISGMACANSAGVDKESFLDSLFTGRRTLQSDHGAIEGCAVKNVGIMDRPALLRASVVRSADEYFPTEVMTHLVTQALLDAGLELPRPRDEEIRLLVGTNFGCPIDYLGLYRFRNSPDKAADAEVLDDVKALRFREDRMSFALQGALGCGIRKLSIGMQCMSSLQSIFMAAALIRRGESDRVLVGAYDFYEPFQYYMMRGAGLIDENPADPFGAAHAGCNYGEAAAVLVVENERSASERKPRRVYGEVVGGLSRCYPTDGKPYVAGIEKTLRDTLAAAHLSTADVDIISPHGAGIPEMDRAESLALSRVFGPHLSGIPVVVHSPFNGYSFSASGYLDIIAMLGASAPAIAPGYAPQTPDSVSPFCFLAQPMSREVRRTILKTKMGYSGAVGALLLRSWVN